MIKIIVEKDSPRYHLIDKESFVIDLKKLSNEQFLELTDNNNFNELIEQYGQPI